jgi:hypothetical protein
MKLLFENWRQYLKEEDSPKKPTAVIIKGNPKYILNHDDFYEEIKNFLEKLGYEASFDKGAPKTVPQKADLWIGHSRGSDRLEGAVPEYAKAVLAIGVPGPNNQPFPAINHPDDQPEVGKRPGDAHFIFTDEMKNKIKEISQ